MVCARKQYKSSYSRHGAASHFWLLQIFSRETNFVRISTTSRIDGCSIDSEAIRSCRRCEVGSVVESKAEAKHADWTPTERSRKTHEPPYDLALDFLAACIVNCCNVTESAIHPILHTQASLPCHLAFSGSLGARFELPKYNTHTSILSQCREHLHRGRGLPHSTRAPSLGRRASTSSSRGSHTR